MARGLLLSVGTENLRHRDKRFAKLYARMLVNGRIDWKMLGRVYKPNDKNPILKAKNTVRRKEIQEMTDTAIIEIYEKQGISTDLIVSEEKAVLDSCKGENGYIDRTNALKVIANWRESLDMKPDKQITTQTQEISYIELLDGQESKQLKDKAKQIEDKKPDNE